MVLYLMYWNSYCPLRSLQTDFILGRLQNKRQRLPRQIQMRNLMNVDALFKDDAASDVQKDALAKYGY